MNRRRAVDDYVQRASDRVRQPDLLSWQPPTTTTHATPLERKAAGQRRILSRNRAWIDSVLPAIRELLLTDPDGATVTADDWRAVLPSDPPHPNILGGLAGTMARLGWITWTRQYTTSKQPAGHSNVIKKWRINRPAVERGVPVKQGRTAA